MSLHKSLKSRDELVRARNVLTRYERLLVLKGKGQWSEDKDSILGLPKVRILKLKKRPKVKEEKPAEGVGAEGAPVAEGEEVKKEPEKIKRERAADKEEKVEKKEKKGKKEED